MPSLYLRGRECKYDQEDEDLVKMFSWFYNKGYAEAKKNRKTYSMHRLVMKAREGTVVDHVNGDKLDNRKKNLRITTVQGNSFNRRAHVNNSLGVRGIQPTENGRYLSYIRVDGKTINLGTYDTIDEASEVYEACREMRNEAWGI